MQTNNSLAKSNDPAEVYNEDFYNPAYYEHTLVADRLILRHLWQYFQPCSIVDVGCGLGSWLKAAHELGVSELIGYDGHWNFFYRQNVFLYVKKGSAPDKKLHQAGIAPLFNPAFLDCVHPFMFEKHRQGVIYMNEVLTNRQRGGFKYHAGNLVHHATQIIPSFASAVKRRLLNS